MLLTVMLHGMASAQQTTYGWDLAVLGMQLSVTTSNKNDLI